MLTAMDAKTETKKKLVVPTVLAIAVLATGCGTSTTQPDAAQPDAAVADASFDAGCVPPEEYDPISHSCVPLV